MVFPDQRVAVAAIANIRGPVNNAEVRGLARLFLRAATGERWVDSLDDLEGHYRVEIRSGEDLHEGWLALGKSGDSARGLLVVRNSENPEDVFRGRVATVMRKGSLVEMYVVIRPHGLFVASLEFDGTVGSGSITRFEAPAAVTIRRTAG